jgi:hypothetical protein
VNIESARSQRDGNTPVLGAAAGSKATSCVHFPFLATADAMWSGQLHSLSGVVFLI